MKHTTHYNIPKPELTDAVNIADIHDIADKFDTLTYEVETTAKNIKTDEDTRVANENKRIEAEILRTSSELTRDNNEQTRTTNESNRVNKEAKRVSDEEIRTTSEQERVTAESNRVLKENERIINEQTRQENETTRTTNESKRVTNESYREETFKRMEEIFDLKAPGDMSKVEYDKDNDGIIDEAKHALNSDHSLESDKSTESTHALSSDVSNSVEWNNVQNRPDVAKIEEQLKENVTKTITQNTNILNIVDNVEGISNITLEGNTVDICKEPIVSDFKGKIQGDKLQNPNIFKIEFGTSLLAPNNSGFSEKAQDEYNKIYSLDNSCSHSGITIKDKFPQMLFSFNVVEMVERKIGKIQGNNVTEKVAWLKKNVKAITCNWWGYGSCPSGNSAYFIRYVAGSDGGGDWSSYDKTLNNNSSSVNCVNRVWTEKEVKSSISNDGFVHYLAYTDASDGTIPSAIYTDYINLEVQLNPILRSVGEKENNKIEVKSIGKNLFNGVYENKFTTGGYPYDIGTLSDVRTAFIRIEPGKTYYIKKYTTSNRLILGLYNSTKLGSIPLKPLKDCGDDKLEGSITNDVNAKYLSIYVSNANKEPKMQVEEGTTATEYEDYKEDKVTINLLEPLKGLPNGVRDTINTDGAITRRVGKVVLNGSETGYSLHVVYGDLIQFRLEMFKNIRKDSPSSPIVCDKFEFNGTHSLEPLKEGAYVIDKINDSIFKAICYIAINKSKLSTPDVEGFKKWLSENPTTIYYELAEPIIENIGQPLTLQSYTNGTIQVDTEVAPYIAIKYPSNLNSRINAVENAVVFMNDNLGNAWRTLLILADRELKMKSITPLSTSDDISKKINEILGVW